MAIEYPFSRGTRAVRANASSSEVDRLSDTELLGQMKSVLVVSLWLNLTSQSNSVMIFAGLETTTAALSRALYMLAKHPQVQDQLRTEICDAMAAYEVPDVDHSHARDESGSARLSYDVLMNLPLLNAVVRETLRLYPSLPVLTRR